MYSLWMGVMHIWHGVLCLEITLCLLLWSLCYVWIIFHTLMTWGQHCKISYTGTSWMFMWQIALCTCEGDHCLVQMQYAIYIPMLSAFYHSWTILWLSPGQGSVNLNYQVACASEFCVVVRNVCGPPVCNLLSLLWHVECEVAPTFLEILWTPGLWWILVLQKIWMHIAAANVQYVVHHLNSMSVCEWMRFTCG
jgi:hypothetical protein